MAKGYDPTRLVALMEQLLEQRNESYREASLRAGLDHGAVRRYMRAGHRPDREALLLLADHFGVNPNDLLVAAGYAPLKMFERERTDLDSLSPDVRALAQDLERIADPVLRRRLVAAIRLLLEGHLASSSSAAGRDFAG